MEQYLNLCRNVLRDGRQKSNRTGVDTIGYHGDMCKYNLRDGFPAVTTKKLAFKSVVAEMLGFLRGYDNAADFRALGCKVWDENANDNEQWLANPHRGWEDDLGRIYGVRWRKWRNWEPILHIENLPSNTGIADYNIIQTDDIADFTSNKSGIIGNIYESTKSGRFRVIRESGRNKSGHLLFDIRFFNTGNMVKNCQKPAVLKGNIKDIYSPCVCNIGVVGNVAKVVKHELYQTWHDMIHRCYGKNRQNNKWYKDNGVTVSDRWLVFENFVSDSKKVKNWELKAVFPGEYSLDKDFNDSNIYDVSTCRWSNKHEQVVNSDNAPSFIAIDPDGNSHIGRGSKVFADEHGLSSGMVRQCVRGTCKSHKGWTFKKTRDIFIYTETDQLKLVAAKLKMGIDDRRLIISGWHPSELDKQCLPVCHAFMQFGIQGNRLNLTMYQRSCDVPLGIPFNIAGYAWLLSVMAKITGHKPGTFTHMMHDIHVYVNQFDLLLEQAEREPLPLPHMLINPKIKTLEDLETWVTPDDFALIGYEHHPHIKYPFTV